MERIILIVKKQIALPEADMLKTLFERYLSAMQRHQNNRGGKHSSRESAETAIPYIHHIHRVLKGLEACLPPKPWNAQ